MKLSSIHLSMITIVALLTCLIVTALASNSYVGIVSAISSTTIKPTLNNSISVLTTTDAPTYTIVTNTTTDLFSGKGHDEYRSSL